MNSNLTVYSSSDLRMNATNNSKYMKLIEDLIRFVNKLFSQIVEHAPSELKKEINDIMNKNIIEFIERNPELQLDDVNMTISLNEEVAATLDKIVTIFKIFIEILIYEINEKYKTTWAKSLVIDSIEYLLLHGPNTSQAITMLLDDLGVDASKFQKIVEEAIPKLEDKEKSIFVAFLTLTDLGPELIIHVSNNPEISGGLNDGVASQIITLVGQGSSYHEGIFGPIPIPYANNICAMIWSKLLRSSIKDERMGGFSLSVIAIGFYRDLMIHLPTHDKMNELFSVLNQIQHVDDITEELLIYLQNAFIELL